MKMKIVRIVTLSLGVMTLPQLANAKDTVSLGELSWMLQNGWSQETIDWIIEDCVADPDCGFGPVTPPNPNEDRIRKFKLENHEQSFVGRGQSVLPQGSHVRSFEAKPHTSQNFRPQTQRKIKSAPIETK